MKALILGCGYLGRRVAARWLDAGHSVTALTRSPTKAEELRAAGITPVLGDVTDPTSLAALPTVDVTLYAVAYDRTTGRDRRAVVVDGLRHALAALANKTDRLVFISTTSVYSQTQGEWIDETSLTEPTTDAGRLALEAEQLLSSPSSILPPRSSTILRLSGLYGPSRLLRRVEQLRAGDPIAGDGDAWLNLIHVEDAAAAVTLAADLARKAPPSLLLVSDDRPVRRREYYTCLAELTGSPPPAFDPAAESRAVGLGKRCRNERAKRELGLPLAYPTFEEGLAHALR